MYKKFGFFCIITCFVLFHSFVFSQCSDCGTGLDGAYTATANTTLAGGTYHFTTFSIAPGVIVDVTGTDTLIIYCTRSVSVQGTLSANGGPGGNGITNVAGGAGGIAVAGGYNGGDGSYTTSITQLPGDPGFGPGAGGGGGGFSGGGGGGYGVPGGNAGTVTGQGGMAYGTPDLSPVYGGSGGGGGSGGFTSGAGGGGAGGGIIIMVSCDTILIGPGGRIEVNGGNGGTDGGGSCGGGGGGSGGSLWLETNVLDHRGALTALGGTGGNSTAPAQFQGVGGAGAVGRIRLNYNTSPSFAFVAPAAGFSGPTSQLFLSVSTTDIDCFGDSTGTATVVPSGGTTPYSYSWSSGDTTSTVSNLPAGIHTITVTDSGGCAHIDTITITQTPTPLVANITSTDVSCHGGIDGTAAVTASGGVPGYSYVWIPGGSTDTSLTGLAGGAYLVTVTDSLGCTDTDTAFIGEPQSGLSMTFSITDVACFGESSGAVQANVAGGTPGYAYQWTPGGGTGSSISGLVAGVYFVTVTDTNNCTLTDSAEVTSPFAALGALLTSTDESTSGASDGTATVNPLGGTPPYTFLWSNSGTTGTITGLMTGTYAVTVTDSNGCTFTDSVDVGLSIGRREELAFGVELFPNPVFDQLHIRLNTQTQGRISFSMNSALGVQVLPMKVAQGRDFSIPVHDLQPGLYWLRMEQEGSQVIRKVWVQ